MNFHSHLLLIAILLISSCSTTSSPDVSTPIIEFADSLVNHHVDSSHIAGASIMIVRDGMKLVDKNYGYGSLELESPVPDLGASFEIGSVTKQFTSAAILRLVKEGNLDLDDDFTEYVNFDTDGRRITIHQLLNHTSGIASYTEMEEFWKISMMDYSRDTLVRMVEKEGFIFEPGEALIYNNSAYFILGLIIEQVSGKTYEEYLKEQFFDPLGMDNTYYCSTSKVVKNKVYGYGFSPEGLRQKTYLNHTWPYAAGSLCSTKEDLFTWLHAIHNGEVFSEGEYQLMITPGSLNDGTPLRYAMGLAHYSDFGHERISHGGGINGFLTATMYYPGDDLYVISLVNTTGPYGAGYLADQLVWQILDKIEPGKAQEEEMPTITEGLYLGAVRGQDLKLEVKLNGQSLILDQEGEDDPDTLNHYLGFNSWADGNERISIADSVMRVDQIYGYYLLKRK